MDLPTQFDLSRLPLSVIVTPILIASLLFVTRVITRLNYNSLIKKYLSPSPEKLSSLQSEVLRSPQIPYHIPFLGNALKFLELSPGSFWKHLIKTFPLETGSCKLLLGGQNIHILFSPHAVNAMFKDKHLNRDAMNRTIAVTMFDLSPEDSENYWTVDGQEDIHKDYIVKTERVNELTANFTRFLVKRLAEDAKKPPMDRVNFYEWMHDHMFHASTTALLGEHLLTMYPDFAENYAKFDLDAATFFFQIPRLLVPKMFSRRAKLLKQLVEWNETMLQRCGEPIDPANDQPWEPLFGSRVNRARQRYYEDIKMAMHSRAGMDLGFIFALSSNSIAAAGWMLMQILNPNHDASLRERVMVELRSTLNADGEVQIAKLMAVPLLQSIWQEVLRLYSDTIVTRDIFHEVQLPLDERGSRKVVLEKGMLMVPSWLPHRDPRLWESDVATPDDFYPERFLVHDKETGKDVFTLNGTAGKLIPFGGGKTMCPGRVFGKQEVLSCVAQVLLTFDFEVHRYVDTSGKTMKEFPGMRRGFLGSTIVVPGGDLVVSIRGKRS